MLQIAAIVLSFAFTAVAVVVFGGAVAKMLGVIKLGQPAQRSDDPGRRTVTMLKETVLHTKMLQLHWVGLMHWFAFAAFIFLSSAVAQAYFQIFNPRFVWPLFGHWLAFEWFAEVIGALGAFGITVLAIYRQMTHPRSLGRKSRFFGSNFWQAYFVEAFVFIESAAILFIRGAEYNLLKAIGESEYATRVHFPVASWFGDALFPDSVTALENIIFVIAAIKIVFAMIWLIVVGRNITMGVAWHRFTAWFNIWFRRKAEGGNALGAVTPMTSEGRTITLDDIEDLDEDSKLGVGAVEDFSWKGLLDFTTCTECGRCQDQCPAWNTEKPLSPKLLMMGLRDHAYAKAPYLQTPEDQRGGLSEGLQAEGEKSLIGKAHDGEWFYNPEGGDFVIDSDVLWSCTSCGACVQQCPVDIEHVDHIMDMRRYQVLVEANFPSELNQLFKGLENKGNPWNMSAQARMDWTKGLDFEIKQVGKDIEDLDEVDWLFWVGCAGAYEDRAKKTTRAVAELLHTAGVSFGVLGNGETCTGDPARRAGNEFVFQQLAQQNAETLKEFKVKKAVTTCAHCFNTLRNEYSEFGVELEVVHHTQLLNKLVREGKLTPISDGAGAHSRSITYHDPCYIGRHNGVYEPPRELLQVLPGAEYKEMPRNSERSFCCGAGGARMWMEETLGERINNNRTNEAVETGADQIAVGCPFCRVMLSDGLTAAQSKGTAREEVEVLDVAQMLLASVKGQQATKLAPGAGAPAAASAGAAAAGAGTAGAAAATAKAGPVETKAEPEPGDATITEETVVDTEDTGPAAKASGGSSLFDTPAEEAPAAPEAKSGDSAGSLFDTPAPPEAPAETSGGDTGGSLFDVGGESAPDTSTPAAPSATPSTPADKGGADLGAGGSLFDVGGSEPKAPAESPAEPESATAEAAPQPDLGAGGSLFDLEAPAEPEAPAKAEQETPAKAEPEATAEPAPEPEAPSEAATPATPTGPDSGATSAPRSDVDISGAGSLFDIEAPEAAAPSAPATESAPMAGTEEAAEAEAEPSESERSSQKESEATYSDEAHEPKKDADINGSSSLFDL